MYLHHYLKHLLLFFFLMPKRLGQAAQLGRAGTGPARVCGDPRCSFPGGRWERRRRGVGGASGVLGTCISFLFPRLSQDALRLDREAQQTVSLLQKKHFQFPSVRLLGGPDAVLGLADPTPWPRGADCRPAGSVTSVPAYTCVTLRVGKLTHSWTRLLLT